MIIASSIPMLQFALFIFTVKVLDLLFFSESLVYLKGKCFVRLTIITHTHIFKLMGVLILVFKWCSFVW